MAHLVENMFSVKETPWHKLGVIVGDAPTADEAIRLAGLNWTVKELPIFRHPMNVGDGYQPVTTHKLLYRDDIGNQLKKLLEE